jgi:hypothetical protein
MKYIKTFESYRQKRSEKVNEEFLGKLFGNLFNKLKQTINKVKGGKQIEEIYNKWLKQINDSITKLGITELSIFNQAPDKAPENVQPDETKAKVLSELFKKNQSNIDKIIEEIKKNAEQEMLVVLKNMGGGAKNPQLEIIIQSKISQFKLDVLNAQVDALQKVGETALSSQLKKTSEDETKKLEDITKDIDNVKPVEYKEGDMVVYLLKDKTKEEWDKLTDDQKKKIDESPAKDIVSTNKISKIDGDNFILLDKDGNPNINKTGNEIISKIESAEEVKVEYKENDNVIYLKSGKTKEDWDKLSDDQKKNVNDTPTKDIVGVNPISKINGDVVTIKGKDGNEFDKKISDIISLSDDKVGGQEDLVTDLGELKNSNPEAVKKLSSIAKLYKDPETNKDKISEIEKQLGGE